MSRANQARLNMEALRQNLQLARDLAPASKLMCVVKADAYGHGAIAVARVLEPLTDALAVACIEEALELRSAGISCPILLLEGVFQASELVTAVEKGLWITIDNETQLAWLEQARLGSPLPCWLKIDTGMHRLGVPPQLAAGFHRRLLASSNAADEIVCSTHLASADDLDSPQTAEQLSLFESTTANLGSPRSAANSPGLLGWPGSQFEWVRPGYMLYGYTPFRVSHPNAAGLRPVMTLTSAIISLRDLAAGEHVGYGACWTANRPSRIATVCIGYGDGYPRQAANGTPVLVNGQRAPLAGRVSMDMITVDVTDLTDVQIGDEVILWGEDPTLGEVADHAGTIGYELTTRMPLRTPRVVVVP